MSTVNFACQRAAFSYDGSIWSQGIRIRWPHANDGITGVSCASARFCVAPDEDGDMRVWNGSFWSVEFKVAAHAISCPTVSFCMGVDLQGRAIRWNGHRFSPPQVVYAGNTLNTVSCPNAEFCLTLGAGGRFIVWNGTQWLPAQPIGTVTVTPNSALVNWVSCPTSGLCVAVLSDGHVITWNGTAWSTPQMIDAHLVNAVGQAATSSPNHPAIGLQSISCPSTRFCVAVGTDGRAEVARG